MDQTRFHCLRNARLLLLLSLFFVAKPQVSKAQPPPNPPGVTLTVDEPALKPTANQVFTITSTQVGATIDVAYSGRGTAVVTTGDIPNNPAFYRVSCRCIIYPKDADIDAEDPPAAFAGSPVDQFDVYPGQTVHLDTTHTPYPPASLAAGEYKVYFFIVASYCPDDHSTPIETHPQPDATHYFTVQQAVIGGPVDGGGGGNPKGGH